MSYSTDFEWLNPRRKRVDIFLYDRCRPPVAVDVRTPAAKNTMGGTICRRRRSRIHGTVNDRVAAAFDTREPRGASDSASRRHDGRRSSRSQCWPHCANVLRVAPYFSSGPSTHYSCIVLIRRAVSRDSINSLFHARKTRYWWFFFFNFF